VKRGSGGIATLTGIAISVHLDKYQDEPAKWIEIFYNRQRIHSFIGYFTPLQFEENYWLTKQGYPLEQYKLLKCCDVSREKRAGIIRDNACK
jgi:hypothetical protein